MTKQAFDKIASGLRDAITMTTDTSREAVERHAMRMEAVQTDYAADSRCCGELDKNRTCAAPACTYGEIMRGLDPTLLLALLARAEAAEAERDTAREQRDGLSKALTGANKAIDRIAEECATAYRRGAEAMRKAASKHICTMRDAWAAGYGQRAGVAYAEAIRAELRTLPIPGEMP